MLEIKSKPQQENQKKIASIFISNGIFSTIIIPIQLARNYAIDKPFHVTVEGTMDGILIKKLELN
jgi:hypothetical protein